jgi:NAD(P)-dependent dehydrogenase (short-subunit alcohol dehydrogenase family)
VVADVCSDSDNNRIVDEVLNTYGRLDVSFINAGAVERASFSEVRLSVCYICAVLNRAHRVLEQPAACMCCYSVAASM